MKKRVRHQIGNNDFGVAKWSNWEEFGEEGDSWEKVAQGFASLMFEKYVRFINTIEVEDRDLKITVGAIVEVRKPIITTIMEFGIVECKCGRGADEEGTPETVEADTPEPESLSKGDPALENNN